jgi:hypothetical protein
LGDDVEWSGRPAPFWVSWESEDAFLPASFYKDGKHKGGFKSLISWVRSDLLTLVEKRGKISKVRMFEVCLVVRLALCDLETAQFAGSECEMGDNINGLSNHVQDSPWGIPEAEELLYELRMLCDRYNGHM